MVRLRGGAAAAALTVFAVGAGGCEEDTGGAALGAEFSQFIQGAVRHAC
ncbi:hypothetical protein [Streptomyces sp. NBC_01571]|nr:hypothetical protein [Streptomyces sp. NBC_01571]MCX4575480.1 hypothetical protein [Streptomyces sp. NBC_01571]